MLLATLLFWVVWMDRLINTWLATPADSTQSWLWSGRGERYADCCIGGDGGQHRVVGWPLHHWQTKTTVNLNHTHAAASIEMKRQNADRFHVDIYCDNTKSFLNHHFIGTPAYTPRWHVLYKWNHSNSYSDTKGFTWPVFFSVTSSSSSSTTYVSYSHSHRDLQYILPPPKFKPHPQTQAFQI